MRIYNFKVNGNEFIKGVLVFCVIICIIIFIYGGYTLFSRMKNYNEEDFFVDDLYFEDGKVFDIPSNQYTNVLKEVHDNIDEYVGKEISFVGYVYKIDYLDKNQFVLARNMIINSVSQNVVVGFLSEYEKIDTIDNLSWVKITGTIEKGNLDGEIPIIKITSLQRTDKPSDEFVYPPDDTYVQTSSSLY